MKTPAFCLTLTSLLGTTAFGQISPDTVFGAVDGRIAVEAEHFYQQVLDEPRRWEIVSTTVTPDVGADGDPNHAATASGGAYLEALPDTRRSHDDKLIRGENFAPEPGKQAILSYKVRVDEPGRYYVWVRTFSTNTEDNGIHVGLNGDWPESGARMQWTAKNKWHWDSKQRTGKVHTGVLHQIWLDIEKAGDQTVQFSMREDGFEFDKFVLTRHAEDFQEGFGPEPKVVAGPAAPAPAPVKAVVLECAAFATDSPGQYIDGGQWLAIDPAKADSHLGRSAFPHPGGVYDLSLETVGENDGQSRYEIRINGVALPEFTAPESQHPHESGAKFTATYHDVAIETGDVIEVTSTIGKSADGKSSRARWERMRFAPADFATVEKVANLEAAAAEQRKSNRREGEALVEPRQADGDGSLEVAGSLEQWSAVTVTLDGPFAHEKDKNPNPFTDYAAFAHFEHRDSGEVIIVPGYFAADGNAGETSTESGTKWRAHLAPPFPGEWRVQFHLYKGEDIVYSDPAKLEAPALAPLAEFTVTTVSVDSEGFYAKGRLSYNGSRYLHFAGSGEPFFKVGADAPETLLAFADFDGTRANNEKKCPLKTFAPHLQDFREDSPTWQDGKGKGLIGAIDYLSGKGVNAMSFLTYNAGGDGDNVWPFIDRDEKFHYDCSKLDQWNLVFAHAQKRGIFLHFKTQETENDDNNRGHNDNIKTSVVPTSLDGGDLGPERKLYYRELVARFGHHLALNWNIGEENTQSAAQQLACANYFAQLDAYGSPIVIHTYPGQQDKVYRPLLAQEGTPFHGASLQNDWSAVHRLTRKWLQASADSGRQWVVCNDEQGPAHTGCPPDTGYEGFTRVEEKKRSWDMHDIRKATLWGNLMAGGAGVEYYFGYKLPENDLLCEDWRSRDKSWEYGAIAIQFFNDHSELIASMQGRDELVDNEKGWNDAFCLANDSAALVYLANGGERAFTFPVAKTISWFNTRTGEQSDPTPWQDGKLVAPDANDWLAILKP